MTVVRPNSISGINSITVATGEALSIHAASGDLVTTLTSASGVATYRGIHVGSGTTTADQGVIVGTGASIVSDAVNQLDVYTNNTKRLSIDSSGLIANGALAPSSYGSPNLLISGTDSTLTMMGNGSTNNTSFTGIKFRVAGGSTGDYTKAAIFSRREGSYNDLSLIFALDTAADANSVAISDEKARITSGGLVGVGTDNPNRQIEVFDVTQGTISIKSGDAGQSSLWLADVSDNNVGGIYYEHNNNALGIRVNDAERARIISTGLVGIGTTNPAASLHVHGGTNDTPFYIDTANTNGAHMRFLQASSVKHYLGCGGGVSLGDSEDLAIRAYDTIRFATANSSTEKIRIGASGEIGVAGAGSISFGTSGQFLRSGGNSAGCQWADVSGGIDEADIWRLTTSFQGNASGGYIGSNWERGDTDGQNHKGTGMSESSGTFTFPSTGFWFVQYTFNMTTQYTPAQPHSHRNTGTIKTTIDNNTYDNAASSASGIYNYGSNTYPSHGTGTCSIIFDVTSTTNCKCRFDWGAGQGSETCTGDTSSNQTFVTFIRLADT